MKDSDLRKATQLASKIFLDINENLDQWAVAGQPVEPKQQSSLKLDEHGIGLREALNCFKEKILSDSIKIAHPMYFGLVISLARKNCNKTEHECIRMALALWHIYFSYIAH